MRHTLTVASTTAALVVLFTLSSRTTALAQSGTGEIWGRVADSSGQTIGEAAITVTNVETGAIRHLFADSHGRFAAPALPVGPYEVTADFEGYAARRQEGLMLHPGERLTLQFELRRAIVPETLTLGLAPAELETARTHESNLVDVSHIENLPSKDRQYLRFTQLGPAVTTDAATGGLSVMDQPTALNRVVIDGFDHTSSLTGEPYGTVGVNATPSQLSQEAVRELRVDTNGYPAEAGRAGAGVISVVTKSGANALHGTAFEFFGDRALNAPRTIDGIEEVTPPYRSNQFGGALGGPIVRGREFFLASYEGLRRSARSPEDQDLALVRLDHHFTNTQRLMTRYAGQQFAGAPWDIRTWSLGVSLNSGLGGSVVNEARVQRSTNRETKSFSHDFDTTRIQAGDSMSFVAGGHSMKAGADALIDTNAARFGARGTLPMVRPDVRSYAAFVQDAWRAGRTVTVDLGVRYDLQTMPLVPRDADNVAPRVGVSWAGTEHSVVRASYGIFYGMTPAIIPAVAALNGGAPNVVVDGEFQNARVQQANVGWEWEKYRLATAGVTYLFARGTQLPRAEETNAGRPVNRVVTYRSTGESLYNGIASHARVQFFQYLFLTASYTFARDDDTAPGIAPLMFGTPAADRRALSATTVATRTRGDNDQDHRAVLSMTYDTRMLAERAAGFLKPLARNWIISGVYTLQSGQPYSAYVNRDINGDGNAFNDLAPGTTRNQYRLPMQSSIDPRVARDFYVGARGKLSLIWEAFNLTNRPNYVSVDDTVYTAGGGGLSLNRPIGGSALADGRVMQLAVRMAF
jgi:hypothetical protein